METLYKAAVVGLGRIGSSYPSADIPRTHTCAYKENKRIKVVAGVDPDVHARMAFAEKWGNEISVFSSVTEMLSEVQPDIISLCVHPFILPQIVEECRLSPPKLFFLEKPVVVHPDQVPLLQTAINNVPAAVNYHRCWDPVHIRFFEKVFALGEVVAVRVIYNNGMFNYASHAISLLLHHFGSVSSVTKLGNRTYDDSIADPSFDFILGFESGFDAVFQGFDGLPYDLLELEVISTTGIYTLKAAGCRRRMELPKKNTFYPGYTQLIDAPPLEIDSPVEGLPQAIGNIVNFLDGETSSLSCDLTLGLDVFDILWRVKELTPLNQESGENGN